MSTDLSPPFGRAFLRAQWRNLAMVNYIVEPQLLERRLPRGVELDQWRGKTYVSLVGFLFRDTRVLGIPIPFHSTFEEVNLRFYVRRRSGSELRRGVVFIRELVPRRAIAFAARVLYEEPYAAAMMSHRFEHCGTGGSLSSVQYAFDCAGNQCGIDLSVSGDPQPAAPDSEEEFITEHYWGYTARSDGSTSEYRVTHPRWNVRRATAATVVGDTTAQYGPEFAAVLRGPPQSAFLADGSAVTVHFGSRLTF